MFDILEHLPYKNDKTLCLRYANKIKEALCYDAHNTILFTMAQS